MDHLDSNDYIDEPNRIADLYRTSNVMMPAIKVEKRLEFIDISDDGNLIMGSSDLTGRFWKGSIWYFDDPSLAPNMEASVAGMDSDSSTADGKFFGGEKIIVTGEDSGAVVVYKVVREVDETPHFDRKCVRYEHDSCVLRLSVSSDRSKAVSGGMDMSIKVWDTDDLFAINTYQSAHSHHVTCVEYTHEAGSYVFASCGLDGAALLWDPRQSKPATVIIDNPSEGLSAVSWMPGDTHTLAVGSSFGNMSIVDLRNTASVKKSSPYKRSIHRLFPLTKRLLAACADTNEVKVVDTLSDDMTVTYSDGRHSDFVRGLAFDNTADLLYSCGWDKQVFSHSVLQF